MQSALDYRLLKLFLLGLSILIFVLPATATPPDFVNLPEAVGGKRAVEALRNARALEKVARAHRLSVAELIELFEDRTVRVDTGGRIHFIDDATQTEATTEASAELDVLISLDQAFSLHSKPGSSKTIYLDFTGATISGTAWNTTVGQDPYTLPAFDLDGSPAAFSDTERGRIIQIWQRVVEDFSPFDVNVTTEAPDSTVIAREDSSDQEFGTVALITRSFAPYDSAGGVAYYGGFGNTSLQPAMVFFDNLGNGNAKYTAEAVSHELGHNLDLRHDGLNDGTEYYRGHGSGATSWSPIMGVGYYTQLTQWSKGEYANANNTQDDYVYMAERGLGIRSDDHGDTTQTATFLAQGATFGATGIVERREDIDFFSFNAGAGALEVDVFPRDTGANLDIFLKVYDPNGSVIAQSNPTDLLEASLTVTLETDGVYFASVEGTGKGDISGSGYSDYGSLGQYTIVGSITDPGGNAPPTAIMTANPSSGEAPLTVQFDGSQSGDSDGSIIGYAWDFADGNASSAIAPSHTFNSPGTYTVALSVTDDGGLQDTTSVTITVQDPPNIAPVARPGIQSPTGVAPFVAYFTSESYDSDGSIVSHRWNFGDGNSSTDVNPSNTYTSPGTYIVALTVHDNDGASDSDSLTITVEEDPTDLPYPLLSISEGNFAAHLSWTDNSSQEDGFRIFRRTESGKGKNKSYSSWQLIGQTIANTTSYTDSGLATGTTYQYQVEIWNAAGGAAFSNLVSMQTGKSGGGGGSNGGGKGNNKKK